MICSFEYRFDEVRRFARNRYPEAFGSRIFNPLRWRPPTGGVLAAPRTAWAISAQACCVRRSSAAWVSSSQKNLPRTAAKASLKTTGERFPLVHP